MEEDSKFKTRLYSQPGEMELDKNPSSKSLSHEEAIEEINRKTQEILELLSSSENDEKEEEKGM